LFHLVFESHDGRALAPKECDIDTVVVDGLKVLTQTAD
jgi:hypothetical protein